MLDLIKETEGKRIVNSTYFEAAQRVVLDNILEYNTKNITPDNEYILNDQGILTLKKDEIRDIPLEHYSSTAYDEKSPLNMLLFLNTSLDMIFNHARGELRYAQNFSVNLYRDELGQVLGDIFNKETTPFIYRHNHKAHLTGLIEHIDKRTIESAMRYLIKPMQWRPSNYILNFVSRAILHKDPAPIFKEVQSGKNGLALPPLDFN